MQIRRVVVGVLAGLAVLIAVGALALSRSDVALETAAALTLTGRVTSEAEGRMEGVVVTAKPEGSTIAVSVITDAEGPIPVSLGKARGRTACPQHPRDRL